ncbi:MFS transporter [Streptomyces abyssomicinicus]|uniref:MFS transporter n=1 Tax=Streptomyces abyssomicinicus TaxID=574929 RepID=UPI0012501993|nr:MFS transporter [Streptomyces abyssomicinicus]
MTTTDLSGTRPAGSPHPAAGGPRTRERLALLVLLTASFTLAVDFSILNVALPRIGADLGFALADLQWIATSFALCAAGFTLFFGRCADLYGRRRQFLAGIALLGVASLAGGLAQEPWLLLAARVAQGIATAAVTPAALSLLTTAFPEGPSRERALGLNGALMAAGFTTGAVLGGLLTDLISWRWAFFVNVIVAVVVLAVAPAVLREGRAAERPQLDLPGAVTVTLALIAGVFGLTRAGEGSWSDPAAWGSLAAAAVLLALFLRIESRVRRPLLPPRLLARRSVGWGNLAGMLAFATETSLVFLLTLYLQEVRGFTPLQAGLTFAVLGAGTVAGGMAGPRVIARLGGKRTVVAGFAVQAAATAPLLLLGHLPGWLAVLLVAAFMGGAANLVAIVGYMVTATSGLPDAEQGVATGLATMSQQVGITLGTPVMSTVVALAAAGSAAGVERGVMAAVAVDALLCAGAAVLFGLVLPRAADARGPGRVAAVAQAG